MQASRPEKCTTSLKIAAKINSRTAKAVAICEPAQTLRNWRLSSWKRSIVPSTSCALSRFQREGKQPINGGQFTDGNEHPGTSARGNRSRQRTAELPGRSDTKTGQLCL